MTASGSLWLYLLCTQAGQGRWTSDIGGSDDGLSYSHFRYLGRSKKGSRFTVGSVRDGDTASTQLASNGRVVITRHYGYRVTAPRSFQLGSCTKAKKETRFVASRPAEEPTCNKRNGPVLLLAEARHQPYPPCTLGEWAVHADMQARVPLSCGPGWE
ncbi:hypothetical protein A9K55_003942 [Cordyceps militaris]|uniref:Uncharacterized protein n=1 Tax=Cordyceps militaris TaxID=73501 RepID=A0A2H4SL66_CORMI|nr:hypothetical protein A9K55_003942 [Cordyceps militaris]